MTGSRAPEPSEPANPSLTAACRAFLRAGIPELGAGADGHVAACSFCSARLAAKQRLALALRVSPVAPAELHSPSFLDGIRTRIIEQSEQSGIGAMLDKAMPVPLPAKLEDAFPMGLLESDLASAAVRNPGMARSGSGRIHPDADSAWPRIRATILADLAGRSAGEGAVGESMVPRILRGRGAALASLAAAAIICAMLVSEGTPPPPTIVITDMAMMPSVEFSPMAVLRHGVIK